MDNEHGSRSPGCATATRQDPTAACLSPRRPLPEVLQALRSAHADGRLEDACRLLVRSFRPVLRRAAFQLVHARGLEHEQWIGIAQQIVEQVVLDDLPTIVRQGIPVAGLLIILRPPMERAWSARLHSTADPGRVDAW